MVPPPVPEDIAFGHRLKTLRESAGLSQEVLAERAHIHRTYVSQIERGLKSPSLRILRGIAEALGVTVSNLVSGAGDGA